MPFQIPINLWNVNNSLLHKIKYILLLIAFLTLSSHDGYSQENSECLLSSDISDAWATTPEWKEALSELQNDWKTDTIPSVCSLNKVLTIAKLQFLLHEYDSCNENINAVFKKLTLIKDIPLRISLEVKAIKLFAALKDQLGENTLALKYYEKALRLSRKNAHFNEEDVAFLLEQIGIQHENIASYDKAEEYLYQSLHMREDFWGSESYSLSSVLHNLAILKRKQGKYADARKFYKRVLSIFESNKNTDVSRIGLLCHNLAILWYYENETDSTVAYFARAIKYWSNDKEANAFRLAHTQMNMGNLLGKQEKYDSAFVVMQHAVDQFNQIFGDRHPELAYALYSQADILAADKKYKKALMYYQKALIANSYTFSSSNIHTTPWFKEYLDAPYFLQVLKSKLYSLLQEYKSHPQNDYIKTFYATSHTADSLISHLKKEKLSEKDKLVLSELSGEIYALSVDGASYFHKKSKTDKDLNECYYFMEKGKMSSFMESMERSKIVELSGISEDLLKLEAGLLEQVATIRLKVMENKNPDSLKLLRNAFFTLNRDLDAIRASMEEQFPEYYKSSYVAPIVPVTFIQKLLEHKEAVVSYFICESHLVALIIQPHKVEIHRKRMNPLLASYVQGLRNSLIYKVESIFEQTSTQLYQWVWGSITPHSIESVWIIPQGVLNTLPFEVLTHEDKFLFTVRNKFLLEEVATSYQYSCSMVYEHLIKQKNSTQLKNYFGFAPVFEDTKNLSSLTPLTSSRLEIEQSCSLLEKKLWQTESYYDTAATVSNFLNSTKEPIGILHLATHAQADAENPEKSVIYFYPDSSQQRTDVRFAEQIFNSSLNVQLLILSACETGTGKITQGEGILGLSRAFLFAGAQDILATHWKVPDASSKFLVTSFISKYLKLNNLRKSIHATKLEMLQNESFKHPYHWAAFFLIGR